ncbi:MAG: hypothetical protein M3032_07390 [Verrucomicrobiota bacterium]|nr:hypothetical protein [Verrucomicrobiota bacterium]
MNLNSRNEKTIANIRRLIWLYFWLLIFEGALRKWVVPALSNPLLIVRDPVLLLIYLLAIRARIFPKNVWTISLLAIGVLSFGLSFLVLWPYLPPSRIALVSGYGFRANFFHLPLIFLLPRALRAEDVKRFGWWTLAVLVPMALLMVAQFRSAPDSFLNRTAGGEGEMMLSALGKVRTAATFSFVVGVAAYFSLATAFLIWAALRRDVFKNWLLFAAGSALVIGGVVSGSRLVVGACVFVVGSLLIIFFIRPTAVNRFGQTLVMVVIAGVILTRLPVFKEGFEVLSTRFNEVAEATEKSVGAGLIERVASDFTEGVFVLTKAPFLGYGLGIGTNAGAKFLTGHMMFLLSEGEWSRIFLESGPVLGLAYVLWRLCVVVSIGLLCLRSVKAGNLLPLLLFSATILPLINGQFGQPTVLGFAVFVSGLALAARNEPETDEEAPAPLPPTKGMRRVAGRSAYANRLHGPAAATPPPAHINGSVVR